MKHNPDVFFDMILVYIIALLFLGAYSTAKKQAANRKPAQQTEERDR